MVLLFPISAMINTRTPEATYDDQELNDIAAEARLDRPTDPLQDDVLCVQSLYHKNVAAFQLAHQEAKEEAEANTVCICPVIIDGRVYNPELKNRLAELEILKVQALAHMKRICAVQMAGVLCHYLVPHGV